MQELQRRVVGCSLFSYQKYSEVGSCNSKICLICLESFRNYFKLKTGFSDVFRRYRKKPLAMSKLSFVTPKDRNTLPLVSLKKVILKNFSKFTRKHLCQSLFFNIPILKNICERAPLKRVLQYIKIIQYAAKYSRMDRVKFVEGSL